MSPWNWLTGRPLGTPSTSFSTEDLSEESTVDRAALEQRWELARRKIQLAAEWGKIPDAGDEFIDSPHLDVLRERIFRNWETLANFRVIQSCLALIQKTPSDVGATILGYAILKVALLEAGLHEEAEYVADLQVHYLADVEGRSEVSDAGEEAPEPDRSDPAEE